MMATMYPSLMSLPPLSLPLPLLLSQIMATMSMMKKALHMGMMDTDSAARIFFDDLYIVYNIIYVIYHNV